MPVGVADAAGGVNGYNGKIYVISGYNSTAATIVSDVQIYDPKTDSWSSGTAIPTAVQYAAGVWVGWWNYVYVFGGASIANLYEPLMQIYDIGADSWSTGTSMPIDLKGGSAEWMGGNSIYYIGGQTWGIVATDSMLAYSPWTSPVWTTLSGLPQAVVSEATTVGVDGILYMMGGSDEVYTGGPIYNSTYRYAIENDTWIQLPNLTAPRTMLGAASTRDGRILAIGGYNSTSAMDSVESLKIATISATLAPATVKTGDSMKLTMSFALAYAEQSSASVTYYLKSSSGMIYPGPYDGFYTTVPGDFVIYVPIPEMQPAGSYVLHYDLGVSYVGGSGYQFRENMVPFTVVSAPTDDQQISDLQDQIDHLQNELDNKTKLLQNELDNKTGQLQDSLDDMDASSVENLTALEDQIANLLQQLIDLQTTTGTAKDSAASANMFAMIGVIVAIVVALMVAINIVMTRKKA
jgi:hypothetical protein